MKCLSCSGVSPEASKFCQFCGGTDFAAPSQPNASSTYSNAPAHDSQGKIAEVAEAVFKIKSLPVNKFRWLPFLFNVSYLAGYGNTKEANRTIGILLGGYVVVWILELVGQIGLATTFLFATVVFGLYYCYLVSTRIDSLVVRGRSFNWPVAIGYWIVYAIVSSVFTSRL